MSASFRFVSLTHCSDFLLRQRERKKWHNFSVAWIRWTLTPDKIPYSFLKKFNIFFFLHFSSIFQFENNSLTDDNTFSRFIWILFWYDNFDNLSIENLQFSRNFPFFRIFVNRFVSFFFLNLLVRWFHLP